MRIGLRFPLAAMLLASCQRTTSIPTQATDQHRVLVVVSAADTFELASGHLIESGYFISELGRALRKLDDLGFTADFATPGGKIPTIDTHGLDLNFYMVGDLTNAAAAARERDLDLAIAEKHFGRLRFSTNKVAPELDNALSDLRRRQEAAGLTEKPMLRLEDLTTDTALERYAGLYVPGGHAPKVDLVFSDAMGKVLRHFHARQKPTAIICHAPIVLLSTMPDWDPARPVTAAMQANFPYAGYQITLGSKKEEWLLENALYLKGHKLKYYVEDEAREAGLRVNTQRVPSTSQVVTDWELLTGANPASTRALAEKFADALTKTK